MEPEVPPAAKPASRAQHRHTPSKPATPRRSTKGPLDLGDDPLSAPSTPPPKATEPSNRSAVASPDSTTLTSPASTQSRASPAPQGSNGAEVPLSHLSHLTRPGNFHALPPAAHPLNLPPATTPLSELLASGHFRAAAILSARQLAAPPTSQSPATAAQILSLWHIRLAAICLLAYEHIAADESRALGDVVDGVIYRSPDDGESILPWGLRVLAIRLQARAEGDLGRGIINMHMLAREARRRAKASNGDDSARQLWAERLADLQARVVSLLVEMGDLDGAARMLESSKAQHKAASDGKQTLLDVRLVLLYLHTGNVQRAKEIMAEAASRDKAAMSLLEPLLAAAEGDSTQADADSIDDDAALQNKAVRMLYNGNLEGARTLLKEATARGARFPTLVFNLTTMFELTSDNAKELKTELAQNLGVAADQGLGVEHSGADLKL